MKDWSKDIYAVFTSEGMPQALANLMVAQCKHESANFSSHVFLTDNNLNGYKFIGQPLATRGLKSPEGDYYAHYATPLDSARELARWVKRRVDKKQFPPLSTITTPDRYAQLLKIVGYYGAPMSVYVSGLKKYLKDYGAATAAIGGGLVLMVALLWAFFSSVKK